MAIYIDPFGDGFGLVSHHEAVNLMPNMFDKLIRMGLFRPVAVNTPAFPVEVKKNQMSLVPISPWGTDKYAIGVDARRMNYVTIPHSSVIDQVLASDVAGSRAFGSTDQFEQFGTRLAEKQRTMKNSFDQTREWRMLSALKGKVLDADAMSVIFDPYDFFGTTRKTFYFSLVDSAGAIIANTNVALICREITRWFRRHAFGERIGRAHLLVSPSFFDALKNHPAVEKYYLNWQAAQNLISGGTNIFEFEGVTFEEYDASVPSFPKGDMVNFFDEFEGVGFPLGTMNTFVEAVAPAITKETVNTLGQLFYSWTREKDWSEGTEVKMESNTLPILLRPNLAVTVSALPEVTGP